MTHRVFFCAATPRGEAAVSPMSFRAQAESPALEERDDATPAPQTDAA